MKPRLIRFSQLADLNRRFDYHIHTSWTDGHASVKEFIDSALAKNLNAIAFTEHVRRNSTWFDLFVNEVTMLREKNMTIEVYVGVEAKALNSRGDLDADEHMLKKSEIVLGAVHRYPDGSGGYLDFKQLPPLTAMKIEFGLACGLLRNPAVNVLAHPGGVFERQYKTALPEEYLREIINIAIQQGKAIEINSSYLKDFSYHLALCSELNPLVSLGSDAHSPAELGNAVSLVAEFFGGLND